MLHATFNIKNHGDFMARASHLIDIDASQEKVRQAFTELQGVQGWWTEDAELFSTSPKIFKFKFGSRYQNKMQVLEETDDERWQQVRSVGDHGAPLLPCDIAAALRGTIPR